MKDQTIGLFKTKKDELKLAPTDIQPEEADEDEKYVSRWIVDRQSKMDMARPDEDWEDFKNQFEAVVELNDDGTSDVNLPLEFALIEDKLSEEFATSPKCKIIALGKDDIKKVEAVDRVWEFVWLEANTTYELMRAYLTKNIFGSCPWFEGIEVREKTIYEPAQADGEPEEYKEKTIKNTKILGRKVDIRNFWLDDRATSIENAEDCIEEETITYGEVKEKYFNKKIYKNIDRIKPITSETPKPFTYAEEDSKVMSDESQVKLWHYWNKRKCKYIIVANEKTVIRDKPNPYAHNELPYSMLIDHLNDESVYGRGECSILRSGKSEQNTFRNAIIDQTKFSTTPPIMMGAGITFEDDEPIFEAGAMWEFTGDIGQVKQLEVAPPGNAAFNINGMFNDDHVAFTGIDIRALLAAPAETATKTAIKTETRLKRINLGLKLSDFFLQRMARQRLANIMQFFPKKTAIDLNGKKGFRQIPVKGKRAIAEGKDLKFEESDGNDVFEARPEYIRGNFDIEVVTGSTLPISKELEKRSNIDLVNSIAAIASIDPETLKQIDMKSLWEDLFRGFNKDPEELMAGESMPQEEQLENVKQAAQKMMEDLPLPPEPTNRVAAPLA